MTTTGRTTIPKKMSNSGPAITRASVARALLRQETAARGSGCVAPNYETSRPVTPHVIRHYARPLVVGALTALRPILLVAEPVQVPIRRTSRQGQGGRERAITSHSSEARAGRQPPE